MFFKEQKPLLITGAAVAGGFVLGWLSADLAPWRSKPPPSTGPVAMTTTSAPSPAPALENLAPPSAEPAPAAAPAPDTTVSKPAGDFRSRLQALERGTPSPRRDREISELFEAWAFEDPRSAMAVAERYPDPLLRDAVVSAAVGGWVQREPEAAFAWATTPSRVDMFGMIAIDKLAKRDPEKAMKLTAAVTGRDEGFFQQAYGTIIGAVAGEGRYAEARTMIEGLRSPQLREQLASELASTWGRYQPQQAAQWLMNHPEGAMRESAIGNVAFSWAQSDPQGAARFAAALPPGGTRKQALVNAVIAWADKDITAASDWLDKFDMHRDNDAAVAAIATSPKVVKQNPEVALSWAESIVSPEERAEAIAQITHQWAERDRSAARLFLEKTDLVSPSQRADLLARLAQPSEE